MERQTYFNWTSKPFFFDKISFIDIYIAFTNKMLMFFRKLKLFTTNKMFLCVFHGFLLSYPNTTGAPNKSLLVCSCSAPSREDYAHLCVFIISYKIELIQYNEERKTGKKCGENGILQHFNSIIQHTKDNPKRFE